MLKDGSYTRASMIVVAFWVLLSWNYNKERLGLRLYTTSYFTRVLGPLSYSYNEEPWEITILHGWLSKLGSLSGSFYKDAVLFWGHKQERLLPHHGGAGQGRNHHASQRQNFQLRL